MKTSNAIYSQLAIRKELANATCILAETQRQEEEYESFILKKREGFRYALGRGSWHGDAVGELL